MSNGETAAMLAQAQQLTGNQNSEQMQNPAFLLQMVAQQQQYIQILLAKQKELMQQLQQATQG